MSLLLILLCHVLAQPGPDAFQVVENSQLVVARYATKNNASRYTINGRASNYKEVQTLLKEKGIDLDHNRFLILQVSLFPRTMLFFAHASFRFVARRAKSSLLRR